MKKLKVICFITLVFCTSCKEYSIVNLTDQVQFQNVPKLSPLYPIEVKEIWIHGADKDRNFEMIPDLIVIELKMTIANHSNELLEMNIEMHNSDIKGVFNFRGTQDTLHFNTNAVQESVVVKPNESNTILLGNSIYDFEGLFEEKKDYTHDMVKVLESIQLYLVTENIVTPIGFSNVLKVYGKSKKR